MLAQPASSLQPKKILRVVRQNMFVKLCGFSPCLTPRSQAENLARLRRGRMHAAAPGQWRLRKPAYSDPILQDFEQQSH